MESQQTRSKIEKFFDALAEHRTQAIALKYIVHVPKAEQAPSRTRDVLQCRIQTR
jgi:hypothetical protein